MKMKSITLTLTSLITAICAHAFPYTITDTDYDIEFETTISRAFDSNLRNVGNGGVTIDRYEARLSHDQAWMDGYFDISAYYEHSKYDVSNASLIGTAYNWGMDFAVLQHIDGPWSAVGRIGLEIAKEKDASYDRSFLYTVMAGAAYKFSDDLTVTVGIFYDREFEDDNILLPIIALDWQITDQLRLRTANGLYLDYDMFGDKQTTIMAKLEYDRRQYRLDGFGGNAAIEDTAWELGVAVKHYFHESFYIKPFAEYMFAREFTIRNAGTTSDIKADPGFQMGLTGGFEF